MESGCPIIRDWALGKKHVFLTEGTRQHLEMLRTEKRRDSVTRIQAVWRGYMTRKRWPALRRSLQVYTVYQSASQCITVHQTAHYNLHTSERTLHGTLPTPPPQCQLVAARTSRHQGRPRPQPISGTPPPDTGGIHSTHPGAKNLYHPRSVPPPPCWLYRLILLH